MPHTLLNPNETSTEHHVLVNKKKSYINRVMNAYGRIELTIFFILFVTIAVLVFTHNFLD